MLSGEFPRPLRPKERDLIDWVLPLDRPGYRQIRDSIECMEVIGEGTRGEGDVVLGSSGAVPDASVARAPVVAYGVVETTREFFTITLRGPASGQLDLEIVSDGGMAVPDHFEEKRRWTYSEWKPGQPSPGTSSGVREVLLDDAHVLALCVQQRRLWLYDGATGIVHLIPVTNFYNELMLAKNIRDPKRALESGLLFEQLDLYSDDDLRKAFLLYNMLKPRTTLAPAPGEKTPGWRNAVRVFFARRSRHDRD
jgi:hypothetical protein